MGKLEYKIRKGYLAIQASSFSFCCCSCKLCSSGHSVLESSFAVHFWGLAVQFLGF